MSHVWCSGTTRNDSITCTSEGSLVTCHVCVSKFELRWQLCAISMHFHRAFVIMTGTFLTTVYTRVLGHCILVYAAALVTCHHPCSARHWAANPIGCFLGTRYISDVFSFFAMNKVLHILYFRLRDEPITTRI